MPPDQVCGRWEERETGYYGGLLQDKRDMDQSYQ